MTLHGVLVPVVGALFALGAALAVHRIVRGPTILDRMIASDVLLTTMMLVLGAVMAEQRRTDLLPVLLVLAGAAGFATIAVARSVSRHDRGEADQAGHEPLATVPDARGVLEQAREEVASTRGEDARRRPDGPAAPGRSEP